MVGMDVEMKGHEPARGTNRVTSDGASKRNCGRK